MARRRVNLYLPVDSLGKALYLNCWLTAARDEGGRRRITRYHVTAKRLVKEFINYQQPKPNQTEDAVDS